MLTLSDPMRMASNTARVSRRSLLTLVLFCAIGVLVAMGQAHADVVDLYPDVIVRPSDLYNNAIVTNIIPGHTHLAFSNGTPNIGTGPLYLYGILPALTDSTQLVMQRIFRSDGTYYDDTAGTFIYHPTHNHIHFEDWCIYRLREILPGDGVGAIVASSPKTSFCVLDLVVYNSSLPGFSSAPYFNSCTGTTQGLSVGWLDIYTKSLPGQNIDITNVPPGVYWLESEADPDNHIHEADETNNIARIKVTIGGSSTIAMDRYEPDDSMSQVATRVVGLPNSPNLGPCAPRTFIDSLSIHQAGDPDYYHFYSCATGTTSDTVRIDFIHAAGDLDLRLINSSGLLVRSSEGTTNTEQFTLNGMPRGWYYVYVFGFSGATNPDYSLTIKPPHNSPPSITVIDPPAGVVERPHAFQNYIVTWSASDPNNDPTWVTVYLDTLPVFNGDEIQLEASINTDGALGFHVVNSAAVPVGKYWVYCQITDGGTVTGAWSNGQIDFYQAVDSDGDGIFDFQDNCIGWANPSQQPGCVHHGDPVPDGVCDIFDVVTVINTAFRDVAPIIDADCPHSPGGRTDVNCDGVTDILDVTLFINKAFRDDNSPFCNPCACTSYPTNCPK
jgi:hypothetical protein